MNLALSAAPHAATDPDFLPFSPSKTPKLLHFRLQTMLQSPEPQKPRLTQSTCGLHVSTRWNTAQDRQLNELMLGGLMCIVIRSLGRHPLTPIVTSVPWNLSAAVSTLPPPFTSVTHTSLTQCRLEHAFTLIYASACSTNTTLFNNR